MLIQPEVCLDHPMGMSQFCFDKQTVMDLDIELSLSTTDSASNSTLRICKICRKYINLERMRTHIGLHIIQGDIETQNKDIICGFCGMKCSSILVKTSRGKSKVYYGKIESDCCYYFDYGKLSAKPSRNNPCTNRLVHCSVNECKQVVWSYNMEAHFESKNVDAPSDIVITQAEIAAMKK